MTLRLLGLEPPGADGAVYSEAELKLLLERSTVEGELEEEEQEMLYKVFDFADKEAADVMVPRPEVVVARRSTCRRRSASQACSTRRTRAIPSTARRRSTSSACSTSATS